MFVKINGVRNCPWPAVDHTGEVLEVSVSKRWDGGIDREADLGENIAVWLRR